MQNDLLPHVKVFVSQCGTNSFMGEAAVAWRMHDEHLLTSALSESMYHGIPVLAIPWQLASQY